MYYWLAAAIASVGAGAAPVPLMPSSKWFVDYQDNSCVVSRSFGSPPGSIQMGFQPNIANDGAQLILVLPTKADGDLRQGTATIALQPSGKVLTTTVYVGQIKDRRGATISIGASDIDAFMAATSISVDMGQGPPVALATRGMTGTIEALQACQDDLAKKWGVDPADRVPKNDMPNFVEWFIGQTYPTLAVASGQQGRTVALVTIRNDGKVEACRTVITSGSDSLNRKTCQIAITRGRFTKAERDPKGPLRWALLPVAWMLTR